VTECLRRYPLLHDDSRMHVHTERSTAAQRVTNKQHHPQLINVPESQPVLPIIRALSDTFYADHIENGELSTGSHRQSDRLAQLADDHVRS
jgi:hypothetical protein